MAAMVRVLDVILKRSSMRRPATAIMTSPPSSFCIVTTTSRRFCSTSSLRSVKKSLMSFEPLFIPKGRKRSPGRGRRAESGRRILSASTNSTSSGFCRGSKPGLTVKDRTSSSDDRSPSSGLRTGYTLSSPRSLTRRWVGETNSLPLWPFSEASIRSSCAELNPYSSRRP